MGDLVDVGIGNHHPRFCHHLHYYYHTDAAGVDAVVTGIVVVTISITNIYIIVIIIITIITFLSLSLSSCKV